MSKSKKVNWGLLIADVIGITLARLMKGFVYGTGAILAIKLFLW